MLLSLYKRHCAKNSGSKTKQDSFPIVLTKNKNENCMSKYLASNDRHRYKGSAIKLDSNKKTKLRYIMRVVTWRVQQL